MQVHPSQISPGEPFDLFYFIRNHTDGATYYVRAVVYDVKTGEVLATETLTQSPTNSRLFIKTVQSPPDPSGYGRNVVAIATVHTDSGYTTKSQDYEEQEQYYLIKAVPFFGGAGGIDMGAIRILVAEELDKAAKNLPKPKEQASVPYETIYGAIGALSREINRIPKEEADLKPIIASLSRLEAAIKALPEPEKVDLSGTEEALFQLVEQLAILQQDLKTFGKLLLSEQKVAMQAMATDVLTRVEAGVREMMGKQELTIPLDKLFREPPMQQEPAPADIRHLLNG